MRTVSILALSCLVWSTITAQEETEKRSALGSNIYPRAANWISARPAKMLNPENDLGYLLQYLEKRASSVETDSETSRDIRSPLGTMRFGKRRDSPLGTMRFGKRNPLGTMRFGKRANNPLGTMRFGKRSGFEEVDAF